jgi:hypothetical protein
VKAVGSPFRFRCPACGKALGARLDQAGKKARCSCGQTPVVPGPRPAPANPLRQTPGFVWAVLGIGLFGVALLVATQWPQKAREQAEKRADDVALLVQEYEAAGDQAAARKLMGKAVWTGGDADRMTAVAALVRSLPGRAAKGGPRGKDG